MGLSAPHFLLDSVILIDHLNGVSKAGEFLRDKNEECVISPITYAEVLTGYGEDDWSDIVKLLEAFPRMELSSEALRTAAKYRRQFKLRLPDALQAALAFTCQLTLVTRDLKDLPPSRFPFVKVPY